MRARDEGVVNEKGEVFCEFYALNRLVIGGTLSPHKKSHELTWRSPDPKPGEEDSVSSKHWQHQLCRRGSGAGITYLGSRITNIGSTDEDVEARCRNAQVAFSILIPMWRSKITSLWTKIRS